MFLAFPRSKCSEEDKELEFQVRGRAVGAGEGERDLDDQ